MNYRYYLGIDVSKNTLDVELMDADGKVLCQEEVMNSLAGLKKVLKLMQNLTRAELSTVLVCLEPTGHYSNLPVALLLEKKMAVWIAHPTDIRNSIGMQPGKSDKIDAHRIADYARRFTDKARLVQPKDIVRIELQQLLTQREMFIKDRAKYKGQVNDFKDRTGKAAYAVITNNNLNIIGELDKAIENVESKIDEIICSIPEIKRQYELVQSVPGVGKVLARTLVTMTCGFTRFENPRALACHAGIAPFQYTSGTSIKSRNRVSHRSNKRLKSLLHLAAMAAIRSEGELQEYYQRKVAEGKNKMSVLNAVRNKIIHRVFAVFERNTEYRLGIS